MFRRRTRPPARTVTTTLRLDTGTVSQRMADLGRAFSGVQRSLGLQLMPSMVKAAVEAERALSRIAEVMRAPSVQANQPVRVAGLEARYYTRAALDPAYATPEGLRGLVRAVLDPDSEEAEGLWLVSPANRRLVAVSAMTGWETRGERLTSWWCGGVCLESEAVSMPQHSCSPALRWRCEHWNPEEPPLVAHRQWGTTRVEVRCG